MYETFPPMSHAEIERLRSEVSRLEAEIRRLRGESLIRPAPTKTADRPPFGIVYNTRQAALSSDALGNVAGQIARVMQQRQPDVTWIPACDLEIEQLPDGTPCVRLSDAVAALFGKASEPPIYRLDRGGEVPRLRRCLVDGEPESVEFGGRYNDKLESVLEIADEGLAALEAGAGHHAGWAVKACDVVLAELSLAHLRFDAGEPGWRTLLARPRPEYEPRSIPLHESS